MIKVESLTKHYGPTTAVRNISFEVNAGEIVAFLGPNGAGKTTTMRILTGFLPPSEGRVTIAGYDVVKDPLEVKKRIGYLPETPPLYPEMTVESFLVFIGRLKGIANRDVPECVERVMERCAMNGVQHKQIGHLSKGYRQRVGLAQALIHNPEVLILDEPTAGLDPKQIIEVRQLIHELSHDHTIILSTHILPEASAIANRILIINEGKLEASDTPENLIARMSSHESVFMEIDGPAEQVEARLLGVSGVSRVSRTNSRSKCTSWEIESDSDPTIRGALARAVVEAGWGLYEIRPIGLNLEDIFLKLTDGETDSGSPSPVESSKPLDPTAGTEKEARVP